jgi:fatty acid desaturase
MRARQPRHQHRQHHKRAGQTQRDDEEQQNRQVTEGDAGQGMLQYARIGGALGHVA